jgi:hypothetical protein
MRDIYHNVLTTQVFNPAVSNNTKTSSTIDLQGHNGLSVLFALGQAGDTLSGTVFWTLKLQHSDDDSTYADIAAADSSIGVLTIVVNGTTLDKQTYVLGYIGNKRYVKAVATPTGTHTVGTPLGMISLRGHSSYRPVVTP